MAVLVTCMIYEDPIKIEVAVVRTTFPPLEVYGKIFRHSRASNSDVNSPIWQKFELIWDFMAVLVTCMIYEDPIKIEVAVVRTTFPPLEVYGKIFRHSRASNSDVNSPIWQKFELIWDFMAVLVTCMIYEDPIKIEVAVVRTTFPPLEVYGKIFHCSRASNPKETCPIWPIIELNWDFLVVLVTFKFEDDPIKNEVAMDRTRSILGFFGSQGPVTPKWINSLIWLKFELIPEFIAVLLTCKFDEDPIKIEGPIDRTR